MSDSSSSPPDGSTNPCSLRSDSRRLAQFLQQQARADAGGFEDDGRPAAGMRAATDQVHPVELLEPVLRAQVEHLAKVMGRLKVRAR